MNRFPCTCRGPIPEDPCGHGETSQGCPRHDTSPTGDDARAELDEASAAHSDWQTVGELLGIGTSWQIQIDLAVGDSSDAYRVANAGQGGGVIATGISWTEAVQIAGNRVRSEMIAEGTSVGCAGSELELA